MKQTMDEKKSVKELVCMIDQLVSNGSGHVNIIVPREESKEEYTKINTSRGLECSNFPMACAVPTLQKEIDYNPDEM